MATIKNEIALILWEEPAIIPKGTGAGVSDA